MTGVFFNAKKGVMPNMSVKHKTVKNEFPSMKKQMELLNGEGVEVGVLKGEHAWLASIHEYG